MTAAEANLKEQIETLLTRLASLEYDLATVKGKVVQLESALQEEHIARQQLKDRVLALEQGRPGSIFAR